MHVVFQWRPRAADDERIQIHDDDSDVRICMVEHNDGRPGMTVIVSPLQGWTMTGVADGSMYENMYNQNFGLAKYTSIGNRTGVIMCRQHHGLLGWQDR